jgi:lipoyl(octanoyl) transferase
VNFKLNKSTKVLSLGLMDYKEAWDYQEALFLQTIEIKTSNRKIAEDEHQITPNYLILLEHPHVYTLGKSGSEGNLLLDDKGLKEKKATYYKINRGGDITYHGPGQIVGYPILDLDNFFTDIHKYLRLLEEAVILTLKEYGIESGRIKALTGVWIDCEEGAKNPRKICALGVKSSRWVTMHGFAFNVNTDLNYFKNIIPCGIDDKAVTSMEAELGKKQDTHEVSNKLKLHIADLFEMKLFEETSN